MPDAGPAHPVIGSTAPTKAQADGLVSALDLAVELTPDDIGVLQGLPKELAPAVAAIRAEHLLPSQPEAGIVFLLEALRSGFSAPNLANSYFHQAARWTSPPASEYFAELAGLMLDPGGRTDQLTLARQAVTRDEVPGLIHLPDNEPWPGQLLAFQILSIQGRERFVSSVRSALQEQAGGAVADIPQLVSSVSSLADTAKSDIADTVDDIESLTIQVGKSLDELKVKVNTAAVGKLSQAYAGKARAAWWRGAFWVTASIAAGVAAIVIAAHLASADFENVKTAEIVARATLTAAVLVLAGFFSRQATHARRANVSWTHIGLQLQTVNAYLEVLEPEQRREAITDLAPRFFPGQPHDPHSSTGNDTSDLAEVLRLAAEAIRKR